MGAHEQLEKILSLSPGKRILIGLGIVAVIIAALALAFWFGTVKRAEWADSKYLQEREEILLKAKLAEARAASHLAEAEKYKQQNDVLRAQNEAQAAILVQNDAKLVGDAKRFTELTDARNKRMSEIDSQTSESEIICGVCEDSRKAGFPLSQKFCERCK